jgi:hypothetical protein
MPLSIHEWTVAPLAFALAFHFGKAGYVLSYLPAVVLLLLLPVARLDGRWRIGFAAAVALACALNVHRFLAGEGVVPGPLMGRGLPLTAPSLGAPYNVTASVIRTTDRETADYLEMREVFDPGCDELVYLWLGGSHRFRHATLTLPEFTIDLVHEGFHEFRAHRLRRHEEYDGEVTLPHGGQAVLVLDGPTPEVSALVAAGQAEAVALPRSGRVVWVVRPGRRLFGVEIREAPATAAAARCP